MATTPPKKMITQDGRSVTHLDLDALEREARAEPFTFTVGGEVFQMLPSDVTDWKVVNDLDNEGGIKALAAAMLGDDYERFAKHDVPAWKFNRLLRECRKHYGADPGE